MRWLTREHGRSCCALPWSTTVSLSLSRSDSPVRNEKLRTNCSLRARIATASDCRTIAIHQYCTAQAYSIKSRRQNRSQCNHCVKDPSNEGVNIYFTMRQHCIVLQTRVGLSYIDI